MKKVFALAVPLLCFFAAPAGASPLSDFYIRQALDRYFELPQDARTLAMGGSSGLDCRSSACVYLNPAGLGKLQRTEISGSAGFSLLGGEEFLTDERLEQNEYHGYLVTAFPLGEIVDGLPRWGTIDFGYSRYDGHTDDSVHTTPDGHRRSVAYGYALTDYLSLGYSFNFYDDELRSEFADLHSHTRLLHTWGLQSSLGGGVRGALAFKLGVGQSDTEDFRFGLNGLSHLRSYTAETSLSRDFDAVTAAIAFDYSRLQSKGNLDEHDPAVIIGGDESGNTYNIRLGAEYRAAANLILRAGVRWNEVESYTFERPDLEDLSGNVRGLGFSSGIGYDLHPADCDFPKLRIEYGFEYLTIGHGAWDHVVSLSLLI